MSRARATTMTLGGARRSGLWAALRPANAALVTAAAALGLSLLGIYAIDVGTSLRPHPGTHLSPIAARQGVFLLIALGCGLLAALPHYRRIGRASWAFYGGVIGLLVFVILPFVPDSLVTPRNGARAWIDLGPFDLQPSEPAKLAVVMALAWFLRYRTTHRRFLGLVPPGVIVFVPVGLIMLQPDLGQSMLFIPALFFVLVAAGARLRHLAIIVVCAAMAAPAAYPFLQPHQQARIVGLLKQVRGDTTTDQDINFQAVTAQTLVGAGGVHGNADDRARALVGFNRLPERHNDMVFSVIVNRFGLVGGLAVLGVYGVWLAGAFFAAASTKEPFGRLLIVGCCGFVCAQVFINVGMNVGVVPIIGITLPFVSYGGSSLITMWVMTGLIYNVAVRRPAMLARESLDYADNDD